MDELDLYLALVRRQLRVGRRRTEAICTELRSHLEAQALQFEREGRSREQAVAQAIERFGAPKEIAKRLVASNSQYRREEFLKAMWLGLTIGAAVFYAFAVVLYLVHVQSIHSITTYWHYNLVMGGGMGAICGLVVWRWRVRLRTITLTIAALSAVLVSVWTYCLYHMGAFSSAASAWEFVLVGVTAFVGVTAAIALSVGHAVNRWILGTTPSRPSVRST